MVTKFLWKHDLVADQTFDQWHEGYVDGKLGKERRNKSDYDADSLRTSKYHHYLAAYWVGVQKRRVSKVLDNLVKLTGYLAESAKIINKRLKTGR